MCITYTHRYTQIKLCRNCPEIKVHPVVYSTIKGYLKGYIRHFSKLAELTADCQIAKDLTRFVEHKP